MCIINSTIFYLIHGNYKSFKKSKTIDRSNCRSRCLYAYPQNIIIAFCSNENTPDYFLAEYYFKPSAIISYSIKRQKCGHIALVQWIKLGTMVTIPIFALGLILLYMQIPLMLNN